MTTQSTSKHTPSKHTAWQQHIDAWQASGLSQTTYCKTQDIKAHQFSYWKNKLAKPCEPPASDAASHDSLAPSAPATGFVPVRIAASPQARSTLCLELPNGLRLHGITEQSAPLLKVVIAALL